MSIFQMRTMRNILLIGLDNTDSQYLLSELSEEYRLHIVDDYTKINSVIEQWQVDTVLLNLVSQPAKALEILQVIIYNFTNIHISVVVISNADYSDELAEALRIGANDYIIHPYDLSLLKIKLKLLDKLNLSKQSKSINEYKNIRIDHEQHKVTVQGNEVALCYKEYKILQLFMNNPKHIFSREDLKKMVWSDVPSLNTRTIDTHIASIRKKLGYSGKVIKSIWKVGYMME